MGAGVWACGSVWVCVGLCARAWGRCLWLWSWCVCVRVACVVWHAENPVCPFDAPPCVHSKRPRVCRQHAHMLFNMCAWCRCTRGRFERAHGNGFGCAHGGREEGGGGEEGRGSSSVLLTKICPRGVITCFRGSLKEALGEFTHVQFENRSNTACSRFLQPFALPEHAVELRSS